MKKITEKMTYLANAYLRLSREDGDKAESDSIANQRDLILSYLSDKPDIQLAAVRIDDGFSGATFDRPAFLEMIEDIKAGKVNCVIVKDLSRFGRNFVEAGRYIDQIFPEYGVRFIAINDNFDSARGRSQSDNILLPFLNLVNDAFCRDISVKVRSQLEIKRRKGDFIGSFAVYGYLKDPSDHHKLIVDEFAATVVQDIFKWKIEGASQQRIAAKLNEEGVLSPMEYKRFCGLSYYSGFQVNPQSKWTAVAVGRILKNEWYIGTLVQGKRTTPNHKVKKTIEKPPEKWIRIENNHARIVSRQDFAIVGQLLSHDTRVPPRQETVSLFSGLIFCAGCGQNMVKNSVCRNGKTYGYYICCTNRTTKACSSHRIPEKAVKAAVLASLRQHMGIILPFDKIPAYTGSFSPQQMQISKSDSRLKQKQQEIRRYRQLEAALCEALRNGILDRWEYQEMKTLYDNKLSAAREAEIRLQQEQKNRLQNRTGGALWMEKFKACNEIDGLDRRIAVMLIDRIVVYEDCRIDIHFRYQCNYGLALYNTQNVGKPLSLSPSSPIEAVV